VDLAQVNTMLSIWAHPDDEAYLSSGLMARAVEAGVRVVCVTATRGEGGSMDPVKWPPETLGEIREAELLRSLARLGVNEHRFLDMPDVDWDSPLPDSGFGIVEDLMRELDPDVVLTFGPDGMTGHVGHQSVNAWTTSAFDNVARPEASLLFAAVAKTWGDRYVDMLDANGVYRDRSLVPIVPDDELDLLVVLDDREIERKMTALKEHDSQLSGLIAVFGEDTLSDAMRWEAFRKHPVDR
jgi:LmbE family N-acetylglucosaminyl deacetylase